MGAEGLPEFVNELIADEYTEAVKSRVFNEALDGGHGIMDALGGAECLPTLGSDRYDAGIAESFAKGIVSRAGDLTAAELAAACVAVFFCARNRAAFDAVRRDIERARAAQARPGA